MTLRFLFSHRLGHSLSAGLVCVLFLALGNAPVGSAQNFLEPLSETPSPIDQSPPRDFFIQPLNPDTYRDEDVDNNGVADAVQDGGTEFRKGNCCVLELFDELHGCTWGIGLDLEGQEAVDACKYIDYDGDGEVDDEGIHYVQGNLDMSVPDNSWAACSVQCGVLSRQTFCNPNDYTCSGKYPDDPSIDWEDVLTFDTLDQCSAACKPPVPVRTSVGCACAQDDEGEATVMCTIDVAQDPLSMGPDDYASETSIESVTVHLYGDGSLVADQSFVYDANGDITDDDIIVDYLDQDETELQFSADGGITIPGADPDDPDSDGWGGGFHAKITMPPGEFQDGLLQVVTTTGHDDGEGENIIYADVPSGENCGEFMLDAECDLEGDEYTNPGEPILKNTYMLTVPQHSTGEDTFVEFELNPRGDSPACLDTDIESVDVPYFLSDICEYDPDTETISCTVPGGTSPDELDSLWFTALANPAKGCEKIAVTATVTIGSREPVTHEIYEDRESCDLCTSCGTAQTEEECDAMPMDEDEISFCSWDYVAKVQDWRCVSNDENPACPVWYACCKQTLPEPDSDPQADASYMFLYAGKAGGLYRPLQGDQGPWGAGDDERFTEAALCDDAYAMTRWHRQPDEDPESEDEESVAQIEKACMDASLLRKRGIYPRLKEKTDTEYDPNQPDWYCSYAYDDISFTDPDTVTLENPEEREDCEVFDGQLLNGGTVYAYTAYYQEDFEDEEGFSCPATCELVTKKWGTCFVTAKAGCQADYNIDECIALGGMFFTNGASGKNSCDQTCAGGLCGGAPPGWVGPEEGGTGGIPMAPKCGNGLCEAPWETNASNPLHCPQDCG